MANISETSAFDSTVPQIQTTDPVQGGADTAIANRQAKALADRTQWLKDAITALNTAVAALAGTASPSFTGDPQAPTPAAGDDDNSIATTHFVHVAAGGFVVIDVGGNSNVTLVATQWGCAEIILVGVLTGSINVIFPNRTSIGDRWLVANRTTGAFQITCKTAAGAGVKVAQGRSKDIWTDATDVLDVQTDISIRPKVLVAAYTAAPGDDLLVDQSGGAFAVTLPASPSAGDQVRIRGNFASANLTVARNGQQIYDQTGTPQAANLVINRNNASDVFTFFAGAWLVTQG